MTSLKKLISLSFLACISHTAVAGTLSLAETPLYLGGAIKPNIMVMLDNSGSMKTPMYEASGWRGSIRTGFDPSTDYFGIFEAEENYEYDATIAVNAAAYGGITIDTTRTGAFYESNCTPSAADNTCWSGRYLNWLTTRRIDASRRVLIGGKLESRDPFAYGGSYKYKIIANNEFADDTFGGRLINSEDYSPVPNNSTVMVTSPAHENNGVIQTTYDPYAKLTVAANKLYNSLNNQIGEFGTATLKQTKNADRDSATDDLLASAWTTVNFTTTYSSTPVVLATPPTYSGSDPSIVRIKDVTTTSFKVAIEEWTKGNHAKESVSYLVVEQGNHILPGGKTLSAGITSTDKEYAQKGKGSQNNNCLIAANRKEVTDSKSVSFGTVFSSVPVVISAVQTYHSGNAVHSRAFSATTSGFNVALQQKERVSSITPVPSLNTETIGYIALEQGSYSDAVNNWQLLVGSDSVDESAKEITFGSPFSIAPSLIAGITSMNGSDPAGLRLTDLSHTSFKTFVEEETTCDNETGHSNEDVGYFAISGGTALNLALVTEDEPTGILQELAPDARLGVSFYRYPSGNNDIYNNVKSDGGTIKFNIPNNPFVKKPSATNGGGYRNLTGYINSPIDDIVDALEHYPLIWGTTPLAENLWEVIQYFEQDTPYYDSGDFDVADNANPERDPYYYQAEGKALWCAKSSVIVFTDGEPYRDARIPSEAVGYDPDSHSKDSRTSDVDSSDNGIGTNNLDDVAYWAFCDKDKGSCINASTGKATEGSRDLRSDLTGPAAKDKGQFLHVHTVGFANGTIKQILQDTADNAGGSAYAAEDGRALETALKEVFQDAAGSSSASSVALNTGSISSSSMLYQARFNSEDWSGQLLGFSILQDNASTTSVDEEGTISSTPTDAGQLIPSHANRIIVTYDGTDGRPFQWTGSPLTGLSLIQKTLLNADANVLSFLRGDQSNEESNGGTFRNRSTVLGDIVHSSPTYIGPPISRYPDNWGTGEPETSVPYSSFKSTHSSRTPLVYVGANDGMLHAFDAATLVEQFAYVPNIIFDRLAALSDPNYAHQYTVDGTASVIDAFYDGGWHTVLMSGLAGGGQGVFALDVTDPAEDFKTEALGADQVLFEFTDADDADLGYTYGQPAIVRLHNGKWAGIFGNGFNNTEVDANPSLTGNAVIYIVDIETGALISKFDTGVGTAQDPDQNVLTGQRPNGITSPAVIDVDGDNIADAIYAGDLFGNVWKIDISGSQANWKFAFDPSLTINSTTQKTPLYTACAGTTCSASNLQPITTQPQIVRHPTLPGYLVLFGTGKYFELGDNSPIGQVTQSVYGIWDKAESTLTAFDRSDLLQQSITLEHSQFGYDLRLSTEHDIDWSTHLGWYMDLINTEGGNTDNLGERQVSNVVIRNGRIIFSTLLPSNDPCTFGGSGWLMELDVYSGARLPFTPFDLNDDGIFDENDYIHVDLNNDGKIDAGEIFAPSSGKKSQVGIISTPSIVDSEDAQKEFKYTSGSSGAIEITVENPGPNFSGRQSWRQLDFQ